MTTKQHKISQYTRYGLINLLYRQIDFGEDQ